MSGFKDYIFLKFFSLYPTGKGGVAILVKEEVCESVVEIRRRSDRMITMCLIFGEEMIRVKSGDMCLCTSKRKARYTVGYRMISFMMNWFMNGI